MNKYNSNTNSHFKCEALNREEEYFIQRKHTFQCKDKEFRRVVPIIKEAMKRFDVILSIDTTKPRVAKEALGEGASIINDISGLKFNPEVAQIAAKWGAGLVLMR